MGEAIKNRQSAPRPSWQNTLRLVASMAIGAGLAGIAVQAAQSSALNGAIAFCLTGDFGAVGHELAWLGHCPSCYVVVAGLMAFIASGRLRSLAAPA